MFRLILSLSLSVVIARWVYQEVELCAPQFTPYIDYALDRVQIPTHDKWLKTAVSNALQIVNEGLPEFQESSPVRRVSRQKRESYAEVPPEPTEGFSTVAYSPNNAFDRF